MCNLNSNKRRALNILNTTPINCSGGFSSANVTRRRETTKSLRTSNGDLSALPLNDNNLVTQREFSDRRVSFALNPLVEPALHFQLYAKHGGYTPCLA